MDIIDQLYNSHVSAATLDALDKYRIHKDQALHGYHALKMMCEVFGKDV